MSRSGAADIVTRAVAEPARRWTIEDSLETYSVPQWGKGYFSINDKGRMVVHPTKDTSQAIDLKQLIDDLSVRGIHPPVLLRFTDILRHRLGEIAGAFSQAIRDNEYQGGYACIYPIKVNQQRHVVEEICSFGTEYGFGLEAGSKPELLTILAMSSDRDIPMICNGFKDDEFIEMVVLAQKIGKRIIPVIEKWSELELLVKYAQMHEVKPTLGMRVKLSSRGSGKWETSGGARSKFGLFISEILDGMTYLQDRGMLDAFKLMHFHLGSQITNIRNIKEAVNELARVYVQLRKNGAPLELLDIGGGLGVDYDGSQTNYDSSINYTLQEYAADVVYRVKSVCDEAEVPHPTIYSESGRAMVAYHSALIFDVLGVTGFDAFKVPDQVPDVGPEDETPQPLVDLLDAHRVLTRKNILECYHDTQQGYDQALSLFNLGHLTLRQRSYAERVYWTTLAKIERLTRTMEHVPEELEALPNLLSDTYFCNFSVFQSMPDSWAIDQLFPVMPIHRLDEAPTRRGTLADISCDSDGKIDKFPGLREDKNVLELHPFNGQPYHIGAFLIGAYQEILGDMHNLLGDTHVVHVSLETDGEVSIDQVVSGDSVSDVLQYVDYNAKELAEKMRKDVEKAVKQNKLSLAESTKLMRFYEAGLNGYTYLEDPGNA